MRLDAEIAWKRVRKFIKAQEFDFELVAHAHDLIVTGGVGDVAAAHVFAPLAAAALQKTEAVSVTVVGAGGSGVQNAARDAVFRSPGVGNPSLALVTGLNISGIRIDAAGDEAPLHFMIPYDLDPRATIGFRVHWTSGSATAADNATWIVRYSIRNASQAIVNPATVLDTAIAVQNWVDATTFKWMRTARGIMNRDTLTFAGDDVTPIGLALEVELDASDIDLAAEGVWLLGLELDYWPIRTRRSLSHRARHIDSD